MQREAFMSTKQMIERRILDIHKRFDHDLREYIRPCESEIEELMGIALYEYGLHQSTKPQYPVPPYRLDFALIHSGLKVDIECDGHDEHHSTKKQIDHDNRRDNVLQSKGWLICRFSGSRIYNDVDNCIQELQDLVAEQVAKRAFARIPLLNEGYSPKTIDDFEFIEDWLG